MSRAIYFIFIGVLGLILDAAININDDFSPLCVYGFNLNSRSVLLFVRNGLFSEYICNIYTMASRDIWRI